jgi:DivIVA domain-containing protein
MATDIDVPFVPSAAQIRRREFASVRRGYDPDQVRDYLAQVAEQLEILEKDVREARLHEGTVDDSRSGPPPSDDPYERLAKRLTTLLATADQEAEGILIEARAEASRMVHEARSEADRIRVDAQARAEAARQEGNELLEKAKQEADRVLLGLSSRREDLVQHLQDMQTRLIGVAKELEVAIEAPRSGTPGRSGPATPAAAGPVLPTPSQEASATTERRANEDRHDDPVDGLEGMLVDDGLDLPELPALDLDFDDLEES